MKRRTFCAAGLAALTASAVPYRGLLPANAGAEVPILGLDGRQLTVKPADIDELRAALRGELISADQAGYDAARRLWNPVFDRRPALIVRCAGAADVRRAVSFAAAHGLLTAVRGGGHSFSGQSGCDGGLVIDVSPMRAVEVDRARVLEGPGRRRRAQHGVGTARLGAARAADARSLREYCRQSDPRDSRAQAAYGDNYARLTKLKKRYDPVNLFRLNANVQPA